MSSLVAIGHLVFQSWHSLDFLNLATRGSWGQPWIHHFDRNQRWSRLQLFGCRISGGYDSRRNSRMSWDYIGGITASHRKPWFCSNKYHSNCFGPYAACSWVVCKDVTQLKGSPEIGWNSVSNLKFETVASAMRLSSQLKACTDAASWLLSPLPGQKRFQERLEKNFTQRWFSGWYRLSETLHSHLTLDVLGFSWLLRRAYWAHQGGDFEMSEDSKKQLAAWKQEGHCFFDLWHVLVCAMMCRSTCPTSFQDIFQHE